MPAEFNGLVVRELNVMRLVLQASVARRLLQQLVQRGSFRLVGRRIGIDMPARATSVRPAVGRDELQHKGLQATVRALGMHPPLKQSYGEATATVNADGEHRDHDQRQYYPTGRVRSWTGQADHRHSEPDEEGKYQKAAQHPQRTDHSDEELMHPYGHAASSTEHCRSTGGTGAGDLI